MPFDKLNIFDFWQFRTDFAGAQQFEEQDGKTATPRQ